MTESQTIAARPLGIIKNLLEDIGLDITYAYEDLVFVAHNTFLLQMSDEATVPIKVWFNEELLPDKRTKILTLLEDHAPAHSLAMVEVGNFRAESDPDSENITLRFMPLPTQ